MHFRATASTDPGFEQRLDDEAATLAPSELAALLQRKLGQVTAARLVGLADSRQIGRYQRNSGPRPRPVVEMRMREAYKLVGMLVTQLDVQVTKSWLQGTNSRLGDRTPMELVAEAGTAEELTVVRQAARQFILSQATVRDPLADIEAVRAAIKRPMSERLELALSWNLMASELSSAISGERGMRDEV